MLRANTSGCAHTTPPLRHTPLHVTSRHTTSPHDTKMKTYIAKLKSVSPYTSSKYHTLPKGERETNEAHEARTWRHKLTCDQDGNGCINPIAFKFALSAASKYSGDQIPGKGKRTYTKLFESGILITDPVSLGVHRDNVDSIDVFVNADGKRGSGKRVMRRFPIVPHWEADLKIIVLDEGITEAVLKKHLVIAGQFIGVGQYRCEVGGTNGRFEVLSLKEAS